MCKTENCKKKTFMTLWLEICVHAKDEDEKERNFIAVALSLHVIKVTTFFFSLSR